VLAAPAGGLDYLSLRKASHEMELDGLDVQFVSLDDLIAMKVAAGRPKDRIEVEVLQAVRDELGR
jgi:predicted nucleotidyltransferase